MKFDFIGQEKIDIIIFALILIVFALIPAYFYIKNYDKNMQKYKEEQARRKAQGLSKYMKFIIYLTTILTIFTAIILYITVGFESKYFLVLFVLIILHFGFDLPILVHILLIINLFTLFAIDNGLLWKFLEKVF
ncbi:hypothetical protein [Aliarcobacter butzleri]|uniref:hypothetical protein n=1 Tax=Aliarcobacter butzleri TaxID=28197 RepID=UPI00125FC625|nr:hypothetical protein [Aliarcobacter butzleri]MCG3692415.1 hypothetical protein [Aliarcobacter butzleri]MCT7616446.1 hypothetical protein [Aliarcobacter butzleri]MDN5092532.1 hypothetical protein [Aliarcobacter butzleri]MDS1314701.1 hypothetical protein [Aliarcobacter butzleri]